MAKLVDVCRLGGLLVVSLLASVKRALEKDSKAGRGCVSMTLLLNRELEGAKLA